MKYIKNNTLREYVKEELRVSLFQMAHKLAIQTGCEILVKLEDCADHSGCQYYATRTLNLQYMDKGLSKQPWEVMVSGITGLPVSNHGDQSEDQNGSFAETEEYELSTDGHDAEMDTSAELSFANNLPSESPANMAVVNQDSEQGGQTVVHVIKTEPGNSQLTTSADEESWTKTTVTLPFPVSLESALSSQHGAGGLDANSQDQSMDADQIQQQIYIYANTNTEEKGGDLGGTAVEDEGADDNTDPQRRRTPPSLNYQCSLCKKRVSSVPLLVRHAKMYHPGDESMRYHCVPCDREYKHARHLEQHTELHSKASYRCSTCCKGFYRSSTLREHELRDHQGRYRYYCPKCHKGFMRPSTMQTHLSRSHPAWFSKSKVSPRIVPKTSKILDSLPRIIIPVKDGEELSSLCTVTASEAVPSTSGEQGQMTQASGQNSVGAVAHSDSETVQTTVSENVQNQTEKKMMKVMYQCKECGRMYDNANSLVRHIHDRHDSRTKLRCNQCSYRTSRTSDLARHKRAKHPFVVATQSANSLE
ncbi:zinc finger protein 878-like [Acanthaster planci]|uniref:Zinc finger protein 878-like n=1 Tax=Acanthaster planci TaxID=133434 RepID=A0A8B7Z7Y9_ACAPL|nr:zinc finger protein 878-like [Acanthaster planci]